MAERNLILRAASILVAISVVLSSFTGFLIFAVGDAGQALPSNNDIDGAGDWFIGEDYKDKEKYVQGDWSLSGNLTIRSGGMVVIDGGTLEFAQEYFAPGDARNRIFSLIIEDGGKLVLKNATLTARINDIAYAFPSLGIVVRNGGVFEAYDSNIIASGHLLVDDSTFNLTRSHILGHTAVADNCDQRFFPAGEFDDSLVILFMSSRVNLFDSSIEDIYEPGNEDISERYGHEYEFARDVDAADGTRLSANYLLYRMPAAIRGDTTAEEQDLASLVMDDLRSYTLGPETALWLDGIDTAGLMFSAADGVELTLNIDYAASSDFNPDDLNVFYQYRNGNPVEIAPNYYDGVLLQYSLPFMSAQDLYGLNIGVDNTGAGSISIDRLWVGVSLTLDTYRNITVAGNTDLTAVDTYLGVDMSNDQAEWNRLVMMDDSQAFFYGVYIDVSQNPSTPSDRVYPFVTIAESFEATAGSVGASDNTGEDVGAVTDNGSPSRYFEVLSNEMMSLTEFNVSEIRGTVLAVDLYVEYYVTGSGDDPQTNQIQWSDDDSGPQNTGIVPNRSPQEPPFFGYSDLYSQGLTDMASINELSIQFVNGDLVNAIQFDKIWLDITICPTIYIYRWADITVQDRDGQLVSGAEVSAKLQSTEKEAHYYTPDGIQNYPADEVLKYLGKNSENYNVTGPDGKVRIPYLSEIKNVRAENPYVNITYNATVTFKSELWGDDSKQLPIAFQTFMALTQESTSKSYTVILDGLLIQLPDLSVTDNDIGFSPEYVVFGSTVTAHVYVRNQGNIIASNVLVEAYDGTELLNSTTIDVPASGFNYATITWKIDHVGEYPINITVNPYRSIQESNYLNNEASRNITVSLPPGTEDLVIGGPKYPSLTVSGSHDIGANVRIIENGVLTVNGGVLRILQSANGTYTLSVSQNGALKLINGASFTSTGNVRMFLSDDATLLVRDSSIQAEVSITAEGLSELTFDNAEIGAEVKCPIRSEAKLFAHNTTFGKAWNNFGGNAVAHLTDVAIPSVEVLQNARVCLYSWLTVTVLDGSGQALPDADVDVEYFSDPPVDMSTWLGGTTDREGTTTLKVFRSELTAGRVFNMGSVLIRATYDGGDGTIYYDDVYANDPESYTSVSLGAYGTPLMRGTVLATLDISEAKPNLVPELGSWPTDLDRGQKTTLQATIVNDGPVDAYHVEVRFVDEATGWISEHVIPVVPKGDAIIVTSGNWTASYPIGAHNIAVMVDPLDKIAEGDQEDNTVSQSITVDGIIDMAVVEGSVTFDTAAPAASLTSQIKVGISNYGDIAAAGVLVRLYATAPGGSETLVATKSIASLEADESTIVEFEWTPASSGEYTLRVEVDEGASAPDITKADNELSFIKAVVDLPDLSVISGDLIISSGLPGYIVFGDEVTAVLTIRNNGLVGAESYVKLYVAGELLGSTLVNVPASGSVQVSFSWTADMEGTYDVMAIVNDDKAVRELSYDNNEATKSITVGVEENANNYIVGGAELQNLPVYPEGLPIGKNLWIINDGVVTVDGAVLTIDQSYDRQYQIVVSGNGKLVLRNGATLQSDYAVDLILRDNAQLIVEGSAISSKVRIIAEGSSKLTFDEATVGQGINAPQGSIATIDAVNTTFAQAWTEFGGDATAHLTNVGVPSLTVKDNAVIHIYRWLTVTVWDGNGHALPGAYVAVTKGDMAPYANGVTDLDGVALFKVEVAQMAANKPTVFLGGYYVNTTYWYDGPYEGDSPMSVDMNEIKNLYSQYGKSVSLKISTAVPDVDPPIFFDDDNPARGKAVNIWTYIVNNGPVDAYGVRVLFKDNTTGTILYNQAIPVVPKGGQANAVNVSFSWTAIKPLGEHEIFLSVDPYDEIKEVDETNNNNTRLIAVRGIADLVVGVGDITLDPVTPVRERSTTISVRVTNTGDVEANAINVSVYAVDPLGERKLVGTQLINVLPNGTSASVSVSWTPIMAGSHTIQVVVDGEENIEDINRGNNEAQIVRSVLNFPDLRVTTVNFSPPSPVAVNDEIVVTANILNIGGVGVSNVVVNFYLNEVSEGTLFYQATIPSIPAQSTGQALGYLVASLAGGVLEDEQTVIVVVNPDGSIPETDYENNEGEQRLIVKENRADIIFTGELNVGNDLGPVDSAAIGENVYLSIYAKNNGTVTAYDVLFVFYAVDDMGLGTEIGRVYKYMAIGQDVELNITWTVNMTMGDYTLAVISNPDGAVEEIDDADNIASIGITVEAPNTKITFDRLPEPSYEPGKAVLVSGKVSNSNTNAGVSGASLEIWLEKDGQKVGESVNGTTRADGTFGVTLHLRQGLDGQYRIVVSATIGGKTETTSQLVQVKAAPEGGIPWYVYLLIFALVSAVIIAFSAYLYKYGLGRMVECGECAALIPEASKRCPKCGVQFEPGTAKCSECSAWIPSNSTQCPECGTKFITEAIKEEEDAYIKRMREQYEAYVETYREEAKLEMGRKYTDARFPNWWKKHSAFISFEQWLSQEEAKLKSGGTLCPVCGIHNPRGSPICQKCGSTLEVPKAVGKMPDEPAKDAPPRKPLRRMIVRRPVPGTGKDKPASPEAKAEGEAPKADPKAAEEGADKSASGPAGEPSDEAPKP